MHASSLRGDWLSADGGSPFAAKPGEVSQADQATLVQLEKQAWEVAKQKDWQAYNRLLSQDFVGVDDSGVLLGRGRS